MDSEGWKTIVRKRNRNGIQIEVGKPINEGKQSKQEEFSSAYTVFVQNVSKRVHQTALREWFEMFGTVVDVYIAYKSRRYKESKTTFAFVRFKSGKGMQKACYEAHNRLIGGYRILVAPAKYERKNMIGQLEKMGRKTEMSYYGKSREDRTFKEALLKGIVVEGTVREESTKGEQQAEGIRVEGSSDEEQEMDGEEHGINVTVPGDEMLWLNWCLMGRRNASFDCLEIQAGLNVDGVPCFVCPWGGLKCLVRFESEADKEAALDAKMLTFREYFDDIFPIDPKNINREMLFWVLIEEVPIQIWHSKFFEELGNSWGSFVQLDDDTAGLRRFDVARIMVSVHSRYDIPSEAEISVLGEKYRIIVKVEDDNGGRKNGDDRKKESESLRKLQLRALDEEKSDDGEEKQSHANYVDCAAGRDTEEEKTAIGGVMR